MSSRAQAQRPEFRGIFEREFDYVWSTLRQLGVRDADLEDLAHEVFVKVHAQLDVYDVSRPLRPWLFAFAFRVASDYRRLARHRVEVIGSDAEAVDAERPADEALASSEDRALVAAALDAIDLERRAVFVLHDVDEISVPEIAEALGIPTNTAYSRLRVAREEFAAAVHRLKCKRGDR